MDTRTSETRLRIERLRDAMVPAGVHAVLLVAYGIPIVLLAKQIAVPINHVTDVLQAPAALGGLLVAVLILAPESLAAVRAAAGNQLQRSINVSLGTALSSICLTIPAVLTIGFVTGQTIVLGLDPANMVILVLTLVVAMLTFALERTNVLLGAVAAYVVFSVMLSEWRIKFVRRMNDADTEANAKAIDSLLNYETVKYFGNEAHEARRFDVGRQRYEQAAIRSSPWRRSRATARPSAIERPVPAWPPSITSCGDSLRRGKPPIPPSCRSVPKRPRRPVISLCAYAWWPVSQRIASFGDSKTRCRASVSSTTPRLGPMWPPLRAVTAMSRSRISAASAGSWSAGRARTSSGPRMVASNAISPGRRRRACPAARCARRSSRRQPGA